MSALLPLLPLLAPLALGAVALVAGGQPGRQPGRVLLASRLASLGALGLATLTAGLVATGGPTSIALPGSGGLGLVLRLDALSATLLVLVAFVGAVVLQFSRNYLDGNPRHGAFLGGLCLTLAAVMLLVLAGHLVLLVAAWVATSLALHRLLLFCPERPRAVLAARKKFVVARVGDGCLLLAAVLLVQVFGTGDIAAIAAEAQQLRAAGEAPAGVLPAALLVAVAALLKSAQFSTHGWLTEVMETPTPVSALLHAGIVNAGGFLVVRLADVMLLATPSLHLLAMIGGFSALFGAVVMLTATSVKVALAWSTVAQMGFMLLQCGLGAFSAAVLHIVGHSLYKAHAFLSAGDAVVARPHTPPPRAPLAVPRALAAGTGALAAFLGAAWLLDGMATDKPAIVALGAIFVLGLAYLPARALAAGGGAGLLPAAVAGSAALAAAWFLLQAGAAHLLADSVPAPGALDAVGAGLAALAVCSFALLALGQLLLPGREAPAAWRRLQVHVANGLYANALFDRLFGALRHPAAHTHGH